MPISHWKQQLRQIKEHTLEKSRHLAERMVESTSTLLPPLEKKLPPVPRTPERQNIATPHSAPSQDNHKALVHDGSLQQGLQILSNPDPYAKIMADIETQWKQLQSRSWEIWEKKCQERQQQYQEYLQKLDTMQEILSWMDSEDDMVSQIRQLHREIQEDAQRLHHFHQSLSAYLQPGSLRLPSLAKHTPPGSIDHNEALELVTYKSEQAQESDVIKIPPQMAPSEQDVLRIDRGVEYAEESDDSIQAFIQSDTVQHEVSATSVSSQSPWQRWTLLGTAALAQHPQLREDAVARRFVERILSVRASSSVRSMSNEMQQAHKRLSREQWEMLLSLAALRLAQLDLHYSLCSSFPVVYGGLRQIWLNVGSEELRERAKKQEGAPTETIPYSTKTVTIPGGTAGSTHPPRTAEPTTEWDIAQEAKRLKKYLPDTIKPYVDQIEHELFDDSLNALAYLSAEERALMLESLGTRARWIQDHLPDQQKEVPRVCSWFGIIRSHREQWCPESWLNTLDRKFTPKQGWDVYLQELQEKLQLLQENQRNELESELNFLEEQRRQRLIMLESLARLRGLANTLDPSLPMEHSDAKKFLQILEHLLASDLVSSSHGELLQIVAPFASWLAEGKTFRALRKHLRKNQDADMATTSEIVDTVPLPFDESDWQEESVEQKVTEDAISQLLHKIIPQTRGKRALIVGGDEREEKRQRLEKRLQLDSLIWIPSEEGRIRKIDQAVGRMESGQIQLLILLLSFCGHSKVNRLIQAAKRHNVLCIPVDHGHGEVRVVRRIAYYLGYLESSDVLLRN